tara:strand:- start:1165 stop:1725 length:561 start_codon:yes stop_codon:yes gene_type:complete
MADDKADINEDQIEDQVEEETGEQNGAQGDELSLEDTIAQLEADVAAAQDAALRAQADAVNVQRRAEQEVEKARKFALERFAGDLVSVVDNLERALESTDENEHNNALVEGIKLTQKGFLDVLGRYGVAAVDPMGEPFDAQRHQAMSMVPNADVEPNTVIAVMQKGYVLNGRLLRPAMVMVSKAVE